MHYLLDKMRLDVCGNLFQCNVGVGPNYQGCDDIIDEPYVGGYGEYEHTISCHTMQRNCTRAFGECIKGFKDCIEICKTMANIYRK